MWWSIVVLCASFLPRRAKVLVFVSAKKKMSHIVVEFLAGIELRTLFRDV